MNNNLNLTQEELDKLVKSNDLECFSKEQFDQYVISNKELLIKGESEELDEIEKNEYTEVTEEIRSFAKVDVYSKSSNGSSMLEKSIVYIRPKQVEWGELEKSEGEELSKSKSGTYTDTSLNRKLGRVGQKYGSKKEPTQEVDDKGKSDK